MGRKIVVALGGNAILQPGQEGSFENQLKNVRTTAKFLAKLIKDGNQLVVTHGNGPQVGNILRQNEEAAHVIPQQPLDAISGQSQGFIGYMMVQSIVSELNMLDVHTPVVNILTRTEISREDPDFKDPSKPIGGFFTAEEAEKLIAEKGWNMKEDANRGYRRVVPSPKPIKIHEAETIRTLVDQGTIVVASGGGGIPIVTKKDGTIRGVEAVVDKDRSGVRLAQEVDADLFMILTDVEHVYVNYGKPDQKALRHVSLEEIEKYVEEGHFSAGSMGPKVESAIEFARDNKPAIICSLEKIEEALNGESGTIITKK